MRPRDELCLKDASGFRTERAPCYRTMPSLRLRFQFDWQMVVESKADMKKRRYDAWHHLLARSRLQTMALMFYSSRHSTTMM